MLSQPRMPDDLRRPIPPRRAATILGWLVLATLLAVGSAGIVSAGNRPPVAGARSELTYAVDRALDPELKAAAGDLAALSDDVDALGDIGRNALTALIDRDSARLQKAIDAGEPQLALIAEATDSLRTRLQAIPGIGPDDPTRIGTSLRVRYDRLVSALSATDGLSDSWSTLTKGSLAAIALAKSLADHDTQTAAAAKLGRKTKYQQALDVLTKAEDALATSRRFRDTLAAAATDVSILNRWIDLNATYDAAVRELWTDLIKSKGKVTKTVEAAFSAVRTAQAALPPDDRGLILIMADVARGGLNQEVIFIEEARGRLTAASDSLNGG